MAFWVGQKVVCVFSGHLPGQAKHLEWDDDGPVMGETYTILRYFENGFGAMVWLEEIARSPRAIKQWGPDVGYAARRFRPLVERKTDTGFAILREILNRENREVRPGLEVTRALQRLPGA